MTGYSVMPLQTLLYKDRSNEITLATQIISDGQFIGNEYSADEVLDMLPQLNLWSMDAVPQDFIKAVFLAVMHRLLKPGRAMRLCNAFRDRHASVLQVWNDYVAAGCPDVLALVDQLRSIAVNELARTDTPAADVVADRQITHSDRPLTKAEAIVAAPKKAARSEQVRYQLR
jgi:hypothetical protein